MADSPRCKRRKQANPKRNSALGGVEASSDSDDEDKLHIVEDEGVAGGNQAEHNESLNGVKEDGVSGEEEEEEEEEEEGEEEILQKGDTAVIYPEAPEEQPNREGADENDSSPKQYTCPYCSRGYKRTTSLRDHIKCRHENGQNSHSCSLCCFTFTYRSQLDRHMSQHRGGQRHVSPVSAPSRKFSCTECAKAFKYKHHLKEHLRIHSGEKPYECATCKKRFSHSGSYSSHISSRKCVRAPTPTGPARPPIKPAPPVAPTAPTAAPLGGKPLQEQLPVTQIKAEPAEYECKPVAVATPGGGAVTTAAVATTTPTNTAATAAVPVAALPPGGVTVVMPAMGLVSPVSINLGELQNVLRVALRGGKQGGTLLLQPPQQRLISLPAFVDQDGTTRIIINYSISPPAQATPLLLHKAPPPDPVATETAEPVLVKEEPAEEEEVGAEPEPAPDGEGAGPACALCEDCPAPLEALHLLQHRKAANGEAVDSAALDPSFAALLSEAGVALGEGSGEEPGEGQGDVLPLLRARYSANAAPGPEELQEISHATGLPADVVRCWFLQKARGEAPPCPAAGDGLVIVKSEPQEPQDSPLDLSLPKQPGATPPPAPPPCGGQEQPLNLSCLRRGASQGRTLYMASQLPPLVAIAGQGARRTILIPQLTYSYATAAAAAGAQTVLLNGHKTSEGQPCGEERDSGSDEPNDSDAGAPKRRRQENGLYSCDLCSKVFQKGSSLLRHKYEHTGKRPHECVVCQKAFKHKHHLIEHMRLHSGEKPYQCDKCGKRFSHSGSYSQHMNHRYSYCKKDGQQGAALPHRPPRTPSGGPQSDGRTETPPSQLDSEEEEGEEIEEEIEGEDDEAMCVDDIRVVEVDEDYEEGEIEGEEGEQEGEEEMVGEVVEVEYEDGQEEEEEQQEEEHEEEEKQEEKENAVGLACKVTVETAVSEATSDKTIREEPGVAVAIVP